MEENKNGPIEIEVETTPVEPQASVKTKKPKKPIYKRWWFWVIIVVLVFGGFGGKSSSNESSDSSSSAQVEEDATEEAVEEEPAVVDPTANMSAEERNAYRAAKNYLAMTGFSKRGLIDQLSSEYGDNYSREAAEAAVNALEENGEVDWVEQAKRSAQNYLDMTAFSKEGLIDQLSSDYGDKYTREEAEAAVEAVYQ